MPQRRIDTDVPIDLAGTLFPLCRGAGDPTMRVGRAEALRALRTPDGPATLHVRSFGFEIRAEAWGPGAAWALDHAPGMVGATDDAAGFEPHDDLIARLWHENPGIRMTRTCGVMQVLIPTILEQKVTGVEARRAYRRLVISTGEPAPGDLGLYLPPDPLRVAETPYFAFHPWGVERRRAETIRAACAQATRLEATSELPLDVARQRLGALPGVGPWTVAEVARLALGDADAVSVGDYHLPNTVCWALAGEERGTDERMLELLEPYRGHRGRVQQLLDAGHITAPKHGPRAAVYPIDQL